MFQRIHSQDNIATYALYWLIPWDFQSRDKFAEFETRGSFQNDQIHIWVDSLSLAHNVTKNGYLLSYIEIKGTI